MRILYLHPHSWTGEYPMLVQLQSMGHQVCVLEEDRKLRAAYRLMTDFERPGDGISTLFYNPRRGWEKLLTWPFDRLFKRGFDGRNLCHRMWLILRAVRHFRPDVVSCTDGFTYAIPAAFLRRLRLMKVPLVVSYIGGDILDCPDVGVGKRRTPLVSWLIRASLPGINYMRPLCNSLRHILLHEGAIAERIRVIPIQLVSELGLLDSVFKRRGEIGHRLRSRYNIPPDAPLVITLSGNHKGKGLHLLARVWPIIRAAVPNCQWLLCGPADPWLDQAVWPLLRAAKLTESVHFTNTLKGVEVFEHLAAGDLHINPTICEGLNMVTVEAAAVGTPTIGTDGAGIADWLKRFDAGAVVPSGEGELLADAIISALKNQAQRDAWGIAGRAMSADFALDRIARELVALFEKARMEY